MLLLYNVVLIKYGMYKYNNLVLILVSGIGRNLEGNSTLWSLVILVTNNFK